MKQFKVYRQFGYLEFAGTVRAKDTTEDIQLAKDKLHILAPIVEEMVNEFE